LCYSRDKGPNTQGLPPEEEKVYVSECRLNLYSVDYETFQGAIKRFGYKIDLNDEHMKSISKEIKLNFEEMQRDRSSPFAVVYKDSKKFFKDSRHNVPQLQRLGFLLCKHISPDYQVWSSLTPGPRNVALDQSAAGRTSEQAQSD